MHRYLEAVGRRKKYFPLRPDGRAKGGPAIIQLQDRAKGQWPRRRLERLECAHPLN